MQDEREWVDLISQGDEEAFQALYLAYFTRLWRFAWYQLDGQTARVEDVVQEIFLAVWRAANRFRGDATVTTWVFQIAHNVISAARRKQRRQLAEWIPALAEGTDSSDDETQGLGGQFEDAAVERLQFIEAIDHLSAKHQAVIYLVFVQGFSLEEVARILDIPRNTVKSRILNARRALHAALQVADLEEGERPDA